LTLIVPNLAVSAHAVQSSNIDENQKSSCIKGIICTSSIRYKYFLGCRMDWDDYLRDEAQKYRKLAEDANDPLIKQELLELADICDKVANNIEDHMTAG
jgi:hypothetical protein